MRASSFLLVLLLGVAVCARVDAFVGGCTECVVYTTQTCTCGYLVNGTDGAPGPTGATGPAGADGATGATGPAGQDALPTERVLLQGEFASGCMPLQYNAIAAGYIARLLNAWGVGEQVAALRPTWLLLSTERDEFTLANSEYRIDASAMLVTTGFSHRLALFRTSAPLGYVAHGPSVFGAMTAQLSTRVNVTGTSATYRLDHYIGATSAIALSQAASIASVNEVYEQLSITKLTNLRATYSLGAASTTPAFVPYMSVYAGTTATTASTTVAQTLAWSGTTLQQRACFSLVAPTAITVLKTAVYMVRASVQTTTSAATLTQMDAWLRVNGVDVANSANSASVQAANDIKLQSTVFIASLNAGDTMTVMWRSSATTASLLAVATGASPTRPAAPAVVFVMSRLVTPNYLSLTDSSVQTPPTASANGAGALLTFDTVAASSGTLSLVSGNRVQSSSSSAFTITLSIQIAGASAATVFEVWAQQANADVANSNTRHALTGTGDYKIVTTTFVVSAVADLTFFWGLSVAGAQITSAPVGTSPVRPASPGITLLVHASPRGAGNSGTSAHLSLVDQVAPTAGTSTLATFSTVGLAGTMTATTSSRFTSSSSQTVMVTVAFHTVSNAATLFDFWLAVNGVIVPNSGAQSQVAGDSAVKYMARTQEVYVGATSYVEVFWRTSVVGGGSGTKLATFAAVGSRPAIPSARIVFQSVSLE
ncbi:MAG: hypothetical protein Q7V62_01770 [Actinomycetota bacterium]|nr:hypothetical protein [Actinomycetota bacterium]